MTKPDDGDSVDAPDAPGNDLVVQPALAPAKRVLSQKAIARREKVKVILQTIATGVPPAVAIKRAGMPAREFFKVLQRSPSLDRAYELSRQAGAQVLADQGLALAAHLSRKQDATPSQVMSMKLRLDYLRWYVGKLYPKTFQDRLAALDDGGGKKGSLTVVVVMDDRKPHAIDD